MTSAIKITVGYHSFLLPDTHTDYDFPAYINKHIDLIWRYIENNDKIEELSSNPFSKGRTAALVKAKFLSSELKAFKLKTGIIGYPFDMKDISLYITSQNITIKLCTEFKRNGTLVNSLP
ncbi:hypothetical protein [Yersinia similis]|uniref:Uncharacterized protein n=1 Tax=Yersinia similis TaxID=367190 RepID=A0A0T9P041_9GAMM|nr:hypothetical protein [Yersinia similis]AHK20538.1 hypothetical protein BF17_15435 [Yersinia similis]CFQ46353.1 Uncharacterised protein [Yersinia similis]CNB25292.1 Uncharacterised protein [Yersinia similis]CNE11867.1 Uncharacterised protein [Yersinia similis]CNF29936.1 Uncharacterised protein [Yersinia similis]